MDLKKLIHVLFAVSMLMLLMIGCRGSTPAPVTETPVESPTEMKPTTTPEPPTPPTPQYDVSVTEDLVYARGVQQEDQHEWKLDEYAPAEPGNWPAVLFLYGWGGNKEGWASLGRRISGQGIIVFIIDYPNIVFTEAIQDNARGYREMAEAVGCAIRFIRSRASEQGIGAIHLTITGYSHGGGIASHPALAGESLDRLWDEYAASKGGLPRQVECEVEGSSTHVDAFAGLAGSYDGFVGYDGLYGRDYLQRKDPDLWQTLNAAIGENQNLIVRLVHGDKDGVIPYSNSAAFEAVLAEAGYDVKLTQFSGDHYIPGVLMFETIMDAVMELQE